MVQRLLLKRARTNLILNEKHKPPSRVILKTWNHHLFKVPSSSLGLKELNFQGQTSGQKRLFLSLCGGTSDAFRSIVETSFVQRPALKAESDTTTANFV